MYRICLFICTIWNFSCKEANRKEVFSDSLSSRASYDSNAVTVLDSNYQQSRLFSKLDTLNVEEKEFLKKISLQNEFIIISNEVERYYTANNELLMSKLIFSKSLLAEKGYVYYQFRFYGKIQDVSISYSYSLGQASVGFGSVVGNGIDDYVHTIRSCGITNCITQVYHNGKKILETDAE